MALRCEAIVLGLRILAHKEVKREAAEDGADGKTDERDDRDDDRKGSAPRLKGEQAIRGDGVKDQADADDDGEEPKKDFGRGGADILTIGRC